VHEEWSKLGGVDGLTGDTSPEAEAVGSGVVAEEVEGDAGEPGGDGAFATEGEARGPGPEEGLLGKRMGQVGLAQAGEEEAEDALLVGGDDGVEVVEGCCC
jgi:hypothetical protein